MTYIQDRQGSAGCCGPLESRRLLALIKRLVFRRSNGCSNCSALRYACCRRLLRKDPLSLHIPGKFNHDRDGVMLPAEEVFANQPLYLLRTCCKTKESQIRTCLVMLLGDKEPCLHWSYLEDRSASSMQDS